MYLKDTKLDKFIQNKNSDQLTEEAGNDVWGTYFCFYFV